MANLGKALAVAVNTLTAPGQTQPSSSQGSIQELQTEKVLSGLVVCLTLLQESPLHSWILVTCKLSLCTTSFEAWICRQAFFLLDEAWLQLTYNITSRSPTDVVWPASRQQQKGAIIPPAEVL